MIKQIKLSNKFLNRFIKDIKLAWKHQWKVVILSLIVLICCITNANEKSESQWILYRFSSFKKATINPVNDDDKYFQYLATVTLNHEDIGRYLRILKIKPFFAVNVLYVKK